MQSILILVLFVSTSLISFARGAKSPGQRQANTTHVMHIGDSLSVGGFGMEALDRFESSSMILERSFFASCGSSPSSWTTGAADYTTRCGYWERTRDGEIKKTQWSKGRGPAPHLNPKLKTMIEHYQPTHLSVQLGTNLFGVLDPARESTHEYVKNQVRNLLEEAFNPSSTLRACIWIAPPDSERYPASEEQLMFDLISDAASEHCNVIDSRDFTSYRVDNGGLGDGIHYSADGGRKWFRGLWPQFQAYLQ